VNLKLIVTQDNSHSLLHQDLNEPYHSTYGAIRESLHIFIEAGFRHISAGLEQVKVLEIGFGTGLNALLTLIESEAQRKPVIYTSIEANPLEQEIWEQLNYPRMMCSIDYTGIFAKIHLAEWGKPEEVSKLFRLHKIHQKLEDYSPPDGMFDLVYFDAFSPAVQPELWTIEIFEKLYASLKPGGVLTTYSVKGDVVRALKTEGFSVEKIPGPPGKRHILRARKK